MKAKKKLFLYLLLLYLSSFKLTTAEEKIGSSWHFDTKILRNIKLTKQKLIEEDNFKEINILSENKIKLGSVFLERERAKATIIFFHGFCPGGKEVFAPFVKIAPQNCNLLFVDMRSYGESNGPNFFLNLKNYGENDYKDIENTVKFIHKKTNGLPILIFGWCSGAFHSATALIKLKETNICDTLNIKGLIFDSGFGSILQISESPIFHIKHKYTPKLIAPLFGGNKKRARKSLICKFTSFCLSSCLKFAGLFILPSIKKRESRTNLYDKINKIGNTPVLLIHAQDDQYSPWQLVKPLLKKITNKDIWLIEEGKSSHAENHLKQKEEYQVRLKNWVDKVLLPA